LFTKRRRATMGDELTAAEKKTLANNFILCSPPGQTQKVVDDVRKLVGPELDEESLARMVAKVNREQFLSVELPGSSERVLLTPAGQLPNGNFLEPSGQQQLKVDHLQQRCTGVAPLSKAEATKYAGVSEPTRKKVAAAMDQYAAECLPEATVTTYGRDDTDGNIVVTCCVGRCSMNLGSFWSGSWRSEWTLVMAPGASQGQLSGNVKCNVHYFEDGNVQLSDSTAFQKSLDCQSDVGAAFAGQVKQFEEKFVTSMEDIYQTMNEQVLNALRRRLPITKVKFDWDNRASVHKLATELNAFKAA